MVSKIVFGILIILLISAGAVYFSKHQTTAITGEVVSNTTEKIVAYVNNIPITEKEVTKAQGYVKAQSGKVINQTEAIQRVISEKLVLEDAEKNGFTQTTEETKQEISRILATQNQSLEDFKKRVESRGDSYEEELENYRQQLLIEKYLSTAITQPNVTDEETLAYYNQNKNRMFTGNATVPYEQISPQLKLALEKQQGQRAISEYLAELNKNAKIIYMN
jgi:parvulin-like peptidyl-prolyl isomerase